MPAFLLIPSLTTLATAALTYVGAGAATAVVMRKAGPILDKISEDIFLSAAEELGLGVSADGHITDESLTDTVNQKLLQGSGIQIDSLLDRDRLRAGLERDAVAELVKQLGFPGVTSLGGVKNELQEWVVGEVGRQLVAEAGEVFEAATANKLVQAAIAMPVGGNWNDPIDFTPKGISNRRRQAKYRRNVPRKWVKK